MKSLTFAVLVTLFLTKASFAQVEAGKTMIAKGQVNAIQDANDTNQRTLRRRSKIFDNEKVVTGAKSKAQLRMTDGGMIAMKSNSELVISNYEYSTETGQGSVAMELLKGGLRSVTGSIKAESGDYKLKTPVGSIGIRGTHYEIELVNGDLLLAVWDGAVDVTVDSGEGQNTVSFGEGEDYSYGVVSSNGEVTQLLEAPESFQSGHTDQEEEEEENDEQGSDEQGEGRQEESEDEEDSEDDEGSDDEDGTEEESTDDDSEESQSSEDDDQDSDEQSGDDSDDGDEESGEQNETSQQQDSDQDDDSDSQDEEPQSNDQAQNNSESNGDESESEQGADSTPAASVANENAQQNAAPESAVNNQTQSDSQEVASDSQVESRPDSDVNVDIDSDSSSGLGGESSSFTSIEAEQTNELVAPETNDFESIDTTNDVASDQTDFTETLDEEPFLATEEFDTVADISDAEIAELLSQRSGVLTYSSLESVQITSANGPVRNVSIEMNINLDNNPGFISGSGNFDDTGGNWQFEIQGLLGSDASLNTDISHVLYTGEPNTRFGGSIDSNFLGGIDSILNTIELWEEIEVGVRTGTPIVTGTFTIK